MQTQITIPVVALLSSVTKYVTSFKLVLETHRDLYLGHGVNLDLNGKVFVIESRTIRPTLVDGIRLYETVIQQVNNSSELLNLRKAIKTGWFGSVSINRMRVLDMNGRTKIVQDEGWESLFDELQQQMPQ